MSAGAAELSELSPSRERVVRVAGAVYALATLGLGIVVLVTGTLGYAFQPLPRWLPLRSAISYASGAFLVLAGLALFVRKTKRLAALALTVNSLFFWLILLHLPETFREPRVVGNWEGCGLTMSIVAGAWTLFAIEPPVPGGPSLPFAGFQGTVLARRLYGAGLPLIGLAHLLGGPDATVFVPSYLPSPMTWVYFTGVAHVAAGVAIVSGILARLAAKLEAVQIALFIALAHIPAVAAAPTDRLQWAMLVNAVAIGAAATLIAATLSNQRVPPSVLTAVPPGS